MKDQPPIDQPLWDGLPAEARAAVSALVDSYERWLAELEQRLGRNSTNSSRPPSSDPPSLKRRRPPAPHSGRKRGGQPGHRRHVRPLVPPERLRQVVECRPPSCRRCGDALAGDDPEPIRHQVAEVPPIQPVVDEYRLHRLKCPRCRTTTCAKLPPGVPIGAFRPRLRAALSVLAGAYRLGKRPIRQLACDLLGLSISAGVICRLERQWAAELEAPVEGLREHDRAAASAHIDETSWWQGRDKMWLWAAITKGATGFTIAKSRGAAVAKAMLGTDRRKVVISDRFKSYAWVKRRQFCWAHLRRDFQAMIDRGGEAGEVGRRLLDRSDALFRWWHRVRDGTLARSSFRLYVSWLRDCLRDDLRRGLGCGCAQTAATCRELLAGETHLWTFVRVEGIEPTNNHAERALRHGVIYRKLSGGTDSESGSRFVERMLSVLATCRQQGMNVQDYLTRAYRAHLDGGTVPSLIPAAPPIAPA
ncbi:IS66 family transposase [Tautonia plasticadhaerens]|uniref:Transposase IS66 family protein n=1 Tax=Tautonia plasticadhaerens TaxID=2527974 RepID=A0A518H5U4_9BACT|nr:IS66 family transposase [Tautonia plasticadhaerens]QDV36212.1 Transposase IS66 family protein [Tautonia plasticadhaerens]